MHTTLTPEFWTMFVLVLGAGMVLVLVATLAVEALVERLYARRTHRTPAGRLPAAAPDQRRQLHHAHH